MHLRIETYFQIITPPVLEDFDVITCFPFQSWKEPEAAEDTRDEVEVGIEGRPHTHHPQEVFHQKTGKFVDKLFEQTRVFA